jgi:hypothetical protein
MDSCRREEIWKRISFAPDPLREPPALPGRQQKFDIFGSVLYPLLTRLLICARYIGQLSLIRKAVHVYEHVRVYVDALVNVGVLVVVDGFLENPVAIRPL